MSDDRPEVERAVYDARHVVVLTGSGMSAESGIPTFRGRDGLWRGVRAEELASVEGFRRDPERVWEWYRWRIDAVRAAAPNAGHVAVAEWARHADVTVVTQNVDRLHQRAGSDDVHELHGTILRLRCERPECRDGDGIVPDPAPPSPGRCACGARRRPAVVWFGEMLPTAPMSAALSALQAADLVVVVGTSSLVEPAASLPHVALSRGVCVIEVNLESTPLSARATFTLRARAGEALPRLVSTLSAPLDMG